MTVDDVKKYIKKKKRKLFTPVPCRIRTPNLSQLHSLASQIQIKAMCSRPWKGLSSFLVDS